MAAIEGILYKYPKSMFKQTFGVMKKWKKHDLQYLENKSIRNCSSSICLFDPPKE
jgi:hypothetical protein